ncbi:uncharacterized protein LOC111354946 [Spodoptera litura]|uniref:Uncharacterized protein LOC111354946 n=1 Tax=Spodoptera litura TaxID=69820 RepID=A0A9J7IV38_SPOLT|nr:uncharacterized protein LOC111354946 [Spodoptera litura]
MKDTVLLLLCAVALAHTYDRNSEQCNCDPSQAKQICEFHIDSDDVLVAHENCDKFYKCANGKPVAYQCPDNLLYDPVVERCEWPYMVECGDRPISDGNDCNGTDTSSTTQVPVTSPSSSSTSRPGDGTCNCRPDEAPSICAADGSDGVLVAHENCNQFYKCDHGKPVALFCNGNLLYNPYTEQCDWPENVDCGDRVIPDPIPTANPGSSPTPSPSTPGSGTCNCRPDEAPSICAADGSDGVLVAHENCNQFYKCDHGKPVALFCNGNLLYNPYTEQCDWPENVDCGDRVIPDPIPTANPGSSPTPSPSTPGTGTCNCRPDEAPSICAADGSDGVLVAHENCNQFYKCDHGKPVALFCNGNLLYNPYTEQCDWPENVDCGDRVIPDPIPTANPGSSPTPSPSTPGTGTCNCRPDEAPSICAADGSDGVLVAHENCNQFYKCDHGKPVALFCNGNLLYNPYTEQCDWPENVDCGDRVIPDPIPTANPGSSPTPSPSTPGTGTCNCRPDEAPSICAADGSDGVLVAHENCNQFYKCDHGKPVALFCNGNLLYNPYTEQCDWPENVDCGDRVIPDPIPTANPGSSPTPSPSTPGTGTCNCRPDEAPSICAADGSDGVLVAHENCNQFYKCDHGKPVALFCNGNLLYNPYTEQCDWPENVDCGDRVIPDPIPTANPGSSPTPSPSTPGTGTCNCRPDEAPSICAADGSDGVLVAHENCNQFYKCDHGKPVALFCNGNLLYNPYTEQCDWPENVDCGDRVIPDPIPTANPGSSPTPSPSTPGTGTCNCRPDEAPSICAADGSDGVLVAHENCNQFYKCDHGKPVALFCNGNLLYNPYTEQCDWPENVDCGDRVIPDPIPTANPGSSPTPSPSTPGTGTCNCRPDEAPSICAADGSDGVLVAHENCNQFYKCDHGKPVALFCNGNLLYNPYTEQCDWPENVDCGDRVIPDPIPTANPGSSPTPSPSTPGTGTCNCRPDEAPSICAADGSDGVLVAHENCNQFYKCDHGKPVALFCNGNLLYNPYTEQCDWPENVDCGDRVIPDPIPTANPGSSPTPSPSTPGTGTCNCRPDEAPSICAADGSDGVLVAHENCNQFYKCDHGKPVALFCNGNLLYNPYTQQCDWPENVDCGDRVIPDPIPTANPGSSPTPSPSTPGSGTCNCRPDEAPSICAADGSDGVLVAHENCNQFYKCDHGKPVALSCNGNLLYNPYTEQCDWPENVDCGDRVIPDSSQTSSPSPDSESSESSDIDDLPRPDDNVSSSEDCTSNPNDNTCNCDPDQAPSICASANSNGIHIAHENCNQFYKCDNGQPVPFRCPSNLLYNPFIPGCDWPHNVNCGDRIIPDPDDTSEGPQPTVPDDNNDNVGPGPCNHCNPEEAPAICAGTNSNGIYIAHQNCNQFFVCDHGTPVTFSCNSILLYNVYTKQCDWPFNVDCGDRVIPDRDDDSGIDDGGNNNNNNEVHDDPSQAPSVCAGSGSDGVLVAHEYCDQYYICDGGFPLSRPCYGGLLFNPQNQQCDWPSNVNCGNRIVPDDCACNPRNAPKLCSWQNSEGKLIAHDNCNQFYVCSKGVPVAQTCPSNLLYNIDLELCDWPHKVSCENRQLSYSSLNKHWPSRQFLRT